MNPQRQNEDPFAETIDPSISCSACDAVCCRLTVVVMPEDNVPRHLIDHTTAGLNVMARGEDGWCAALDQARMCCSIYELRPSVCRKFAMGGPYCRAERAAYSEEIARAIPIRVI